MQRFKKVTVIGLGYIGLPTAAILASRKVQVLGVDINPVVVDTINNGEIHIIEPDLDIIVNAAVSQGYLHASTKPDKADVFLIAVPTPFKENYQPDLSYIEAAAHSIAPCLKSGDLVILESTSPVGTTEQLSDWLESLRPDLTFPTKESAEPDVSIAHCPERVLPGHVLTELIHNDRVLGGITPGCCDVVIEFYSTFVEGEMLLTNARTAEMCKLVENSFRDVNIALANELSVICDKFGIDIWELIKLANHHPRVNILQPSTGVGGHCIAVDPWFIVSQAGEDARIIRTAREVNDYKPRYVAESIAAYARAQSHDSITCFGLSFKPNIDDLRESPAIEVAKLLSARGLRLNVVEPNISMLPDDLAELGCELISIDDALKLENSTAAILVAHREFKESENFGQKSALDFCGALQLNS